MQCYSMSLRGHKGVKGQVHKDLPIGLKINGNGPYNLLEMLNIFFNWFNVIERSQRGQRSNFQNVPIELKLINNDLYDILSI